jgi:hypothetical protein
MKPATTQQRTDVVGGWTAFVLSVVAVVVYYPIAMFAPGWWRGARLSDMDAPFDLAWLHDALAWSAEYVGRALAWAFLAAGVVLLVAGVLTRGFRPAPPVVEKMAANVAAAAGLALVAVPALAVGWFLCTQIAFLIAPHLGMFHGEYRPAVP